MHRSHCSTTRERERILIAELLKNYLNAGLEPDLYFWRDSAGHKIDVLIEQRQEFRPVEIKSGQTVASDFFSGIRFWTKLVDDERAPAALVYAGDRSFLRHGAIVHRWSDL